LKVCVIVEGFDCKQHFVGDNLYLDLRWHEAKGKNFQEAVCNVDWNEVNKSIEMLAEKGAVMFEIAAYAKTKRKEKKR